MLKNNVEVDVKVKCIEGDITQAKLAEEIGTSAPYVSRLIRNNEKIVNKTFLQLMEKLGYDVELTYVKRGRNDAMVNLSKLEEIKDLRTVWPHEALDFTPWLSQDDNIALLADAVGLDITVDETESSVGDFNVDIFASETGTDRKIIIENQLEDTNHDHLGKLITYASGKSADVIIWVVKHAREEHKAAIEWLNNHTDEKSDSSSAR